MTSEYIIKWINDARGAVKAGATAKQLDAKMKKLAASLNKTGTTSKKTDSLFSRMGASLKKLEFNTDDFTKSLARVIVVAPIWMAFRKVLQTVSKVFSSAVQAFVDYEKGLSRVASVTKATGATQAEFNRLAEQGIAVSYRTSASLKDTTEAMYQLGTAGLSAKEVIAGFDDVLNLSIGTMADVKTTGRLMAGAFQLFGDSMAYAGTTGDRMKKIADTIAYTFSTQQVELQEIATAFGFAANAANSINFEFEALVGTIGFLNTGLLKGSKAGTALTNAIIKAASNLRGLERITGKAFDPNKPLDFVAVMEALNARFGEGKFTITESAEAFKMFGRRGIRAVNSILQRWEDWQKAIKIGGDNVDDFAEKLRIELEGNVPVQLDKLARKSAATWERFAHGIGEKALPAIISLNEHLEKIQLKDLINEITALETGLSKMGASYLSENIADVKIALKGIDVETAERLISILTVGREDIIGKKEMSPLVKEFKEISKAMKDAAEEGGDFEKVLRDALSTMDKTSPKVKFLSLLLLDLRNAMRQTKEEQEKLNKAGIPSREEFALQLKLQKAGGADALQLAKSKLDYETRIRQVVDKTIDVREKELAVQIEQLKVIVKSAKEFRKMVSTSLADALKEGDISSFTERLGEKLRETIINNVSESLTNAVMSVTHMDVLAGTVLEGTKIQRAIITGGDYHAKVVKAAIIEAAQVSAGAGGAAGVGTTGLVSQLIPKYPVSKGGMVPIAPPDYYKTQGAEKPSFLEGAGGWGGVASMAMMTTMFAQMGKGKSAISQAYGTAPGGTTSKASTRSTTVAKITNIQVSPIFNLDGASINDAETIKESAARMAELFKIELMEILNSENVATGNL